MFSLKQQLFSLSMTKQRQIGTTNNEKRFVSASKHSKGFFIERHMKKQKSLKHTYLLKTFEDYHVRI